MIAMTGNPNPFTLGRLIDEASPRNGTSLLAMLPGALLSMADGSPELDCGFIIATWSKRHGRPMLHLLANTDTHWPGVLTPFEPYFIEHVIGGAITADDALGRRVDVADPRSFDIVRDGKALVEAQRRAHRFEHLGPPAYRIGGGVEVATLTRKKAAIRRIHTWPSDRIGELINPDKENP
ncbi:MAG: hypothetical protein WA978_05455 [Sphingopyxis granuli]|uniref:hypothetical protein n=1 Tax=Sphingopyxis granuli TaxID=267128 RepID=UPI003C740FBF